MVIRRLMYSQTDQAIPSAQNCSGNHLYVNYSEKLLKIKVWLSFQHSVKQFYAAVFQKSRMTSVQNFEAKVIIFTYSFSCHPLRQIFNFLKVISEMNRKAKQNTKGKQLTTQRNISRMSVCLFYIVIFLSHCLFLMFLLHVWHSLYF